MLSLNPLRSSDAGDERAISKGTSNSSMSLADVLKTIKGYMEATGQLPSGQPPRVPSESPTRLALIIAPQYQAHLQGVGKLINTLRDVILVYEMLTTPVAHKGFGYKPTDIRILVEGLGPKVRPTRQNILENLDWLVKYAGSNDSRLLYYSGHGTYVPVDKKEGKETVNLSELVKPGDPERDRSSANSQQYSRIDSITVPENELRYYQEALVASYSSDTESESIYDYLIYDHELNKTISALPPGCKFTSLIDACHSGRILNCNYKVEGPGFRGIWHGSSEEVEVSPKDLDASEFPANLDPKDAAKLLEEVHTSSKYTFAPAFTSAPLVTLTERLPENEKLRDKIQADVLSWSACHQRQVSTLNITSTFTAAFTEAVQAPDIKSWTVQQVFNAVNEAIKASSKDNLQYAQIWTSLGQGGEEEANKKLEKNFYEFLGCHD
ncbi:hypothetical protein BDV93DRAFT_566876 [Ceratobasidium sp. AG-I]|nr:hypothetical protein BDV93DRAFT_566876 [Ceratobasidium sp. AG-I]